jgi:hypothetical protein
MMGLLWLVVAVLGVVVLLSAEAYVVLLPVGLALMALGIAGMIWTRQRALRRR